MLEFPRRLDYNVLRRTEYRAVWEMGVLPLVVRGNDNVDTVAEEGLAAMTVLLRSWATFLPTSLRWRREGRAGTLAFARHSVSFSWASGSTSSFSWHSDDWIPRPADPQCYMTRRTL